MAGKISENTKVQLEIYEETALKNKKSEKEKEIGQDESKKFQENIEKITSDQIKLIDEILKNKEEDLKYIDLSEIKKFFKKKINHVALIMDGNGRWANKHGLSKKLGMKKV